MKSVKWEIEQNCNLKCKHCILGDIEYKKTLSLDESKNIVNLLASKGVNEIVFNTKEPLLNKNILNIIKYCTKNNISSRIVTNGTLLNEEIIKKLIKYDVKSIAISLEGVTETSNDYIRGEGVLKKVTENIELLNKYIFKSKRSTVIFLQICLNSLNKKEIDKIYKYAIQHKIYGISLNPILLSGSAKKYNYLKLNTNEYFQVLEYALKKYNDLSDKSFQLYIKDITYYDAIYYNLKYNMKFPIIEPNCGIYKSAFSILSDGEICRCNLLIGSNTINKKELYLGNILNKFNFEDLKKDITYESNYKNNKYCKNCPIQSKCKLCVLDQLCKETPRNCAYFKSKIEEIIKKLLIGEISFKLRENVFIFKKHEKYMIQLINLGGNIHKFECTDDFIKNIIDYLWKYDNPIKMSDLNLESSLKEKLIHYMVYNDIIEILN